MPKMELFAGNQDAYIRIPEISRTSKTYYNRFGIENIMHTADSIKDKIARISSVLFTNFSTIPAENDGNNGDEEEEEEGVLIDDKMITCAICCEIFHRPVR